MSNIKKYAIGSVNLFQLDSADIDSSKYSDGDSEKTLLNIFKSSNPAQEIEKKLSNNPPWPIYYHLSPFRKNVVDWYDFENDAEVLEIGAGCGAVTEALCSKKIKITALELTKRRAEINAHRNSKSTNLDIVIGNLEEYEPHKKFDYVICIGVLEYAGLFINSEEPYESFIDRLESLLKKDGKLIIAIENRLGLKYFSGSREDHTGRFFDSINQYPHPKKVQTFGRIELKELIESNGFNNISFFYPYPDYKNPQLIYSDEYMPGNETVFPIKLLPSPPQDKQSRNRIHLFSEQLSMLSIDRNRLYGDLANSFIVIAQKERKNKRTNTLFYTSTSDRKNAYELKTYLNKDADGKLRFYKEAANNEAVNHIDQIYKNSKELKKIFEQSLINIVDAKKESDRLLAFNNINGTTLERVLFESVVEKRYDKFIKLIDKFIDAVTLLPGGDTTDKFLVDLNFDNIIIDKKGGWNFIDYEWLIEQKVPKNLIVQRSLVYFINRYSPAFRYLLKRGDYVCVAKGWYMPQLIYKKYRKYFSNLEVLSANEEKFQKLVNKNYVGHPIINKKSYKIPALANAEPDFVEEYFQNKDLVTEYKAKIKELGEKVDAFIINHQKLKNLLAQQKEQTRRAELTSPYYLSKKIARRLRSLFN